jgi:hypothetical protein
VDSAPVTNEVEVSIARDFSPFPGGRHRKDGPFSGAIFRDDILAPLLRENASIVLNLDGVAGLPSSFWEEVFGGLIRRGYLRVDELGSRLKLRTSDPALQIYIPMALKFASAVPEPGKMH